MQSGPSALQPSLKARSAQPRHHNMLGSQALLRNPRMQGALSFCSQAFFPCSRAQNQDGQNFKGRQWFQKEKKASGGWIEQWRRWEWTRLRRGNENVIDLKRDVLYRKWYVTLKDVVDLTGTEIPCKALEASAREFQATAIRRLWQRPRLIRRKRCWGNMLIKSYFFYCIVVTIFGSALCYVCK